MSTTEDVIGMLARFQALYEAANEGWKARAYGKAIYTLRDHTGPLPTDKAGFMALPNIGEGIASKIEEFLKKGTVGKLKKLQREAPPESIAEFTDIPGVGMKKAKVLFVKYKVRTLKELLKLYDKGKIDEDWLIRGIKTFKLRGKQQRIPLFHALELLDKPLKELSALSWVRGVTPAGSIRRYRATVKDMDVIVVIDDDLPIEKAVRRIVKKYNLPDAGDRKCYIPAGEGRFVDLYFCYRKNYGTMLCYLTGSGEWGAWLRSIVKKRGGKLNQYYLEMDGKKHYYHSEKSLIEKILGHYVPPECREKPGDVGDEHLVTMKDIKGDFHIHTTKSDGSLRPPEMAQGGEALGYTFIGFADHVGFMPWSLPEKRFTPWIKSFRDTQKSYPIKALLGAEMDVSKHGKLSISRETVRSLDFVIVSAHQNPGENLEWRYLTAFHKLKSFKGLKMLAHPINRNMTKSVMMAWADINWMKIFTEAKNAGVALEINGQPDRMDLDWELVRLAKRIGCKFILSSDAHTGKQLACMQSAVTIARKGGLTPADILNCRDH